MSVLVRQVLSTCSTGRIWGAACTNFSFSTPFAQLTPQTFLSARLLSHVRPVLSEIARMQNIPHQLLPRDMYLDRLKACQDNGLVKVVTGIHGCGKSSLLALMREHLLASGIAREQILSIDFKSAHTRSLTPADCCNLVQGHVLPGRRLYLFLDEPQQYMRGWEEAVRSIGTNPDCDIFIAASETGQLSSGSCDCLAGRSVEIRMLPLSFREFLRFHGFTVGESRPSRPGTDRHSVFSRDGEALTLEEAFCLYLRYGGMPGLVGTGLDPDRAWIRLDEICCAVMVHALSGYGRCPGEGLIRDPELLEHIMLCLAGTVGTPMSLRSICRTLAAESTVKARGRGRRGTPATQTVAAHARALLHGCLFHEVRRLDLKSGTELRTLGTYYMVDMGLRNFLLGYRDTDTGHLLENVVFLELLRRGYAVKTGKIGKRTIDFIATRDRETICCQVTLDMDDPQTREQALAPLRAVRDNCEKLVLTLRTLSTAPADGIRIVPLLDFLLQ